MHYAEYAARAKRMNPIDDDFLKKMAEDKGFCQEVIRTVLDDPELVVVEVRPQEYIKNLQGRSVILDAHCVLADGSNINVEVQKSDDDDHQKRVRYNAACITANIVDPGSRFEHVPVVCAIYITKNDFLGKGKTTYHVDRVIRETGEVVHNGFTEIYVNAYVKDGTPVSELMTIFTEDNAYDDKKFPATSKRKRYFKEDEKGVSEMCAIMQEVKEEGRKEGIEQGQLELVMHMYAAGKLTIQEACTYLGCTQDEFLEKERKFRK